MKRTIAFKPVIALVVSVLMGMLFLVGCKGNVGKHLDLTLLVYSENRPTAQGQLIPTLEKKLNVTINYVNVPWPEYSAARDARIAGGDIPDLFFVLAGERNTEIDLLVNDGIASEITPVLGTYPNIKRYIDGLNDVQMLFGYEGNKIYSIPSFFGYLSPMTILRKDWREAVGLPMPDTWDDVENLMRAFKTKNPGGTALYGSSDTFPTIYYAYTGYDVGDPASNEFELVDGTWVFKTELPGLKDAVKKRVKWFNEGLINRELLKGDYTVAHAEFHTGKSGIVGNQGIQLGWDEIAKPLAEINPKAQLELLLPFPKGPAGRVWTRTFGYYTQGVVSAKSDKDKQARVLAMLDYLYSDEGIKLSVWGVEGVHYTTSGKDIVRKPETFVWDWNDEGSWSFLNYISGNFAASTITANQWIQDNGKAVGQYGEPVRGSLRAPADQADKLQLVKNQISQVWVEWENNFLMGRKDVDKDWGAMGAALKAAGLETYRDALKQWGFWIAKK